MTFFVNVTEHPAYTHEWCIDFDHNVLESPVAADIEGSQDFEDLGDPEQWRCAAALGNRAVGTSAFSGRARGALAAACLTELSDASVAPSDPLLLLLSRLQARMEVRRARALSRGARDVRPDFCIGLFCASSQEPTHLQAQCFSFHVLQPVS